MANNQFSRGDYSENEKRVLLSSSVSKKSIRKNFITYNIKSDYQAAKKSDQATQKGGKDARGFKYLILNAKKVFNLLQYTFT